MQSAVQQAFILAAGKGSRLEPLTHYLPKPLVPIGHKPAIVYILDHLIAQGITRIAINTHHAAQAWRHVFPNNQYRSAELLFFHEEQLLDTGGSLLNIRSFAQNQPLLVWNGDIISTLPVAHLTATANNVPQMKVTLAVNPMATGNVTMTKQGVISNIRNYFPQQTTDTNYRFNGIALVQPTFWQHLQNYQPNSCFSIVDVWLSVLQQQIIYGSDCSEYHWLDIGTIPHYRKAHFSDNPLGIQPTIHPTAHIAKTATIKNSYIGKNVVIEDNVIVTNSIIFDHSFIKSRTTVKDSIICNHRPYYEGNINTQSI